MKAPIPDLNGTAMDASCATTTTLPPNGEDLLGAMRRHLFSSQAKSPSLATRHDHYLCLALAVRDRLLQNWVDTAETYTRAHVRTAIYLSAEYLLGPHLENNLVNLGIRADAEAACRSNSCTQKTEFHRDSGKWGLDKTYHALGPWGNLGAKLCYC